MCQSEFGKFSNFFFIFIVLSVQIWSFRFLSPNLLTLAKTQSSLFFHYRNISVHILSSDFCWNFCFDFVNAILIAPICSFFNGLLRLVAIHVFDVRLLQSFAFSKKLLWLAQTNVISLKTQIHSENTHWKRVSQFGFSLGFYFLIFAEFH